MKYGCLISFWLWALIIVVVVFVTGCSSMPSMQHCHEVSYSRVGVDIHIVATCRAPIGGGVQL